MTSVTHIMLMLHPNKNHIFFQTYLPLQNKIIMQVTICNTFGTNGSDKLPPLLTAT
jgi:hypothetical protein